eukprot:TRINITY_DN9898_c0_g2_i1.p1 TRINITY_DN9898_c0_g2~~TRINITY_DN9898_c0_g2_i1.p1  ORF type:complete len:356 (+),score=76.10 TRINITY_DN9898_c0_g2_i1:92-1159(+)
MDGDGRERSCAEILARLDVKLCERSRTLVASVVGDLSVRSILKQIGAKDKAVRERLDVLQRESDAIAHDVSDFEAQQKMQGDVTHQIILLKKQLLKIRQESDDLQQQVQDHKKLRSELELCKWDICVLPAIRSQMEANQSAKLVQSKSNNLPKMTPNYAAHKSALKPKNTSRTAKMSTNPQIHVTDAEDQPQVDEQSPENTGLKSPLLKESTSLPTVSQVAEVTLPPLKKANDGIPLLTTRSVPLIPSSEVFTLPAVGPPGTRLKGQKFESTSEGGSPRVGRRHKSMVGSIHRKSNMQIEMGQNEADSEGLHLPGLEIKFKLSGTPDERTENQVSTMSIAQSLILHTWRQVISKL